MTLTTNQRQALTMLADAGPIGYPRPVLLMHGFSPTVLEGLVYEGLITAQPETVCAGRKPIQVTRVRITDAGRRALERP
jgi:hypothetical protein